MTQHQTLAAALIAAQQQFTQIKKDNTANTGKFSYTYADLGSVLEAVTPALHDNGLVISQCMDILSDQPCIKTVLMHADSDKVLESFTPIVWADKTDPQKFGGGITYSRRYALMAMLNLNAEDDDATHARRPNGVSDTTTIQRNTAQNASTAPLRDVYPPRDSGPSPRYDESEARSRNSEAPTNPNGPSAAQIRRFHAMRGQLGLSEEEASEELMAKYGVESPADLDWRQYKDFTAAWDEDIKGKAKRGSHAPF